MRLRAIDSSAIVCDAWRSPSDQFWLHQNEIEDTAPGQLPTAIDCSNTALGCVLISGKLNSHTTGIEIAANCRVDKFNSKNLQPSKIGGSLS